MTHVYPPVPKELWVYHYEDDVQQKCIEVTGVWNFYLGCAEWDEKTLTYCNIYLPKNPPEWLVRHEEMHCEGWMH